ncbi:MAG: hypothetical protein KAX27_04595, partial [Candidatus Aminicenantes bacterium]|nr:hypothetical protein [Candidatus Aminicenantes bacterium]
MKMARQCPKGQARQRFAGKTCKTSKTENTMMKLLRGLLIIFLSIIAVSCVRVIVKPSLTFGPSEARWVEKTLNRMTL